MSEFDNVLNGTADKKAEQTVPEAQFDDALEGGGDKKTYGQMMAEKKAKTKKLLSTDTRENPDTTRKTVTDSHILKLRLKKSTHKNIR